MTPFEGHTISYVFEHIDTIGAHLVANTYRNLVSSYAAVFYTFTTLYIGFCFIKMKRGHYDANDFVMIMLRTVCILTLCMNYDYFCLFIYDVFTIEPLNICKALTLNANTSNPLTISHALDQFLLAGGKAATKVMAMGSWSNPTFFIFGLIVFLMILITTAMGAVLIVLAKCASIILLALSPIFIFFALYDATKGLFESYIRQLINYALIPIMTCAILMILLSICDLALQSMNEHGNPTLLSLIPLLFTCVIQIYLLLQVIGKCSALAGGFSMPSVVSSLRQAKNNAASVTDRAKGIVTGGMKTMGKVHGAVQAARQRLGRFSS